MPALRTEIAKLTRSMAWAVVVVLPIVMVLSAVANTLAIGQPLEDGWHTLWLRSTVFYGLFPLAVGIAILASLVWRVEHRGSNWNALMSGPTSSLQIVLGKAGVVALLAAAMQPVLLLAVVVVGKLVLRLPGMLPAPYLAAGVLIVIACLPLAALQSALSMFLRSFAAPVAVGVVAAVVSAGVLLAAGNASVISPYALVARATQLGTGQLADAGTIGVTEIGLVLAASALLTALIIAGTVALLDRRDTVAG